MLVTLSLKLTPKEVIQTADSRYWVSECQNLGRGTWLITEGETDVVFRFNQRTLKIGLQKLMQYANGTYFNDYTLGRILSGNVDSNDADLVLQFATLGEIKYG